MSKQKRVRQFQPMTTTAALFQALREGRLHGVGVAERYGADVRGSPALGGTGGFRPLRRMRRMVRLYKETEGNNETYDGRN